jgi:hypothetical protein
MNACVSIVPEGASYITAYLFVGTVYHSSYEVVCMTREEGEEQTRTTISALPYTKSIHVSSKDKARIVAVHILCHEWLKRGKIECMAPQVLLPGTAFLRQACSQLGFFVAASSKHSSIPDRYVCTSAGIANAAAAVRLKPISWRPSTSHTKVGVTWPMTTTWWCS